MNPFKVEALLRGARWFRRDKTGASAIEFAFIVPAVMVPLYFGAVEAGFALTAERRVAAVAYAAADLAAQAEELSSADMEDILKIAQRVMDPLPQTGMGLVVTSVVTDKDGDAEVDWSRAKNGTARSPGAGFALPAGIVGDSSSVIVAEATYNYVIPVIGSTYTFSHTFYSKPRRSETVELN